LEILETRLFAVARAISKTPVLFVDERLSTYSHGNMGTFLGD